MTSKDLQQLKFNRLSEPEKIILETFKGLKEYTLDYSNGIYFKSDRGLFYYYDEKSKQLVYSYETVSSKLYSFFDGDYIKMCLFIQKIVEEHLKLKIDITTERSLSQEKSTLNLLKLKL